MRTTVRLLGPYFLAAVGVAVFGLASVLGVVYPRPPKHAAPPVSASLPDAGCAYLQQYGRLHGYPPITACELVHVKRDGAVADAVFRIKSSQGTFDIEETLVRSPWQVTAAGIDK